MRFIGHLDLLKFFQRAVKRAKLPISYSQGFNPHQIVSFAIPLPLGTASISEYVDIQLDKETEPEIIKEELNKVLPDGMCVLNVREFNEGEKNAAAIIEYAKYEIVFENPVSNLKEIIDEFMKRDEILFEKVSKKETKIVDIKNSIYSIEVNEDNSGIVAVIATGSKNNLKPEHLISCIGFESLNNKYTRLEMYKTDNDKLAVL